MSDFKRVIANIDYQESAADEERKDILSQLKRKCAPSRWLSEISIHKLKRMCHA